MAFTPGQKLPAVQLNAAFDSKADQTALNGVAVTAASAKAVTDVIVSATAPDAGALNGSEVVTITRGAGVLSTTLTNIWNAVLALFANTSDPLKGDALVGVKQPFTGAVARTQHDKNSYSLHVNEFSDIQTAVNAASLSQRELILDGGVTYNVPSLDIPSNTTIACYGGVATINTSAGAVDALSGGRQNIVLRNIKITGQGGLRMGGTTAAPTGGFVLDNVEIICTGLPHCGYFINITGLRIINRLRVENVGVDPLQYGIFFGAVANLDADWIDINGNISMGMETGGNASVDVIPLYRGQIRKLTVEKNPAYVNDPTHHGIYVHGGLDSIFENVTVTGDWGGGFSVKHRDSHGCQWRNIVGERFFLTSDANAFNLNSTDRASFDGMNISGDFVIFKTSTGDVTNITFKDVNAGSFTCSAAITGPVNFTGDITLNNTTDIQMRSCFFVDADVYVPNLNSSTCRFTLAPEFVHSTMRGDLYLQNTGISMRHCTIIGLFRQDSTAGNYTIDLYHVEVSGSFFANSTGARVVTGNLSHVTFGAAEDTTANNNPDVKNYSFVFFTDRTYIGAPVVATATNDSAGAGLVGQFVAANVPVGSAVSLTSGVPANVTSISLTPGDWDVFGSISTNPAGTTTQSKISGGISTSNAVIPAAPNGGATMTLPISVAAGEGISVPVGRFRISLASTTTVFLVISSTFSVSTNGGYGFIGARRVR